jgi:hypothetical protein
MDRGSLLQAGCCMWPGAVKDCGEWLHALLLLWASGLACMKQYTLGGWPSHTGSPHVTWGNVPGSYQPETALSQAGPLDVYWASPVE